MRILAMMSKIEKNNILVLRSGWPRSKAAKIDYACVFVFRVYVQKLESRNGGVIFCKCDVMTNVYTSFERHLNVIYVTF